ncbi:RimJ/RimL family protein N-acetyltransferase [Bacillus mesophilus]|uniref:GNAT family N-acetyltransferase n=1 Tax=Bacillus mesophilus TaxID=1808955 RepID=A0A6M0Q2S2_9BACI|nr:GNAT family protein [Bacillus mesophilus]MBM7659826.1 RimJ/RimL family protein N-acetyltransferase [Bacillus mesophilus]NEY70685.1 GNAT family N-acetyltransferase [Bacillus mesophilus]
MLQVSLLKGEKIYLDVLKQEDAGAIEEWYKDEEFTRNMDAVLSIPKHQKSVQKMIELDSKTDFLFAIRELTTHKIIGIVGIDGILWNHRTAWISIGIGGTYRAKGLGKEALKLALKLAFLEFNLYRLQLTVFDYNVSAQKLYEQLGFVHEGTYRSFLERDNKRHDMLLYGLLREEYIKN